MKLRLDKIIATIVDNRGKNPPYYVKNGIPVIDNYLICNNYYPNLKAVNRYIDAKTYNSFIRKKTIKDDVLLTLVGNGLGKCCLSPVNTIIIQNTIGLRCNNNKMKKKFLYYTLVTKLEVLKGMNRGASQPSAKVSDVLSLEINVPNLSTQQHIVDSIGSVDDAIEKNEEIIEKIYSYLINKFNQLVYGRDVINFSDLGYFNIVKSGIDTFEGNKTYIDTSSVSNKSIVDTSYNISYDDRPSRANMQPIPNTVWFAKLKDSPKFIIVKNVSKRILNNYVFSTGFMGLEADEYIINYLYLLILSDNFNNQKDASSTGATMMGINNDILYSIKGPNITKDEACSFGKNINSFIEMIIELQEKNYNLKSTKKNLLSKYFD